MNAPYYTGDRQTGRTQKMLEAVLKQVGKVKSITVLCLDIHTCRDTRNRLYAMCVKHGVSVSNGQTVNDLIINSPSPTQVCFRPADSPRDDRGRDNIFADHAVYDFWLAQRHHWFDWMREGKVRGKGTWIEGIEP